MLVRLIFTDEQLDQIAGRVIELLVERQTPVDHGGYLNAEEAARYLACTRERLYDLVQLEKLRPLRDGRRLLFKRSDIDRYLTDNTDTKELGIQPPGGSRRTMQPPLELSAGRARPQEARLPSGSPSPVSHGSPTAATAGEGGLEPHRQ